MTFPIHDNVPPPPRNGNKGSGKKYPFNELQPGQSFFVPNKKHNNMEGGATLANMQSQASRRSKDGKRFYAAVYPTDQAWLQIWREQ